MDSSYHHIQSMGQSPFFYYNPDPKPDNRQHGHFSQQPSSIHIPIYHSQVHQLPSTPIYSRPNSSGSQPMHPPQMYNHTGFTPNMTPMASPQPVYQKSNVMMQDQHSQPRLMIDPNIHDGDMYYYPSTPPLSASASSLSSPANGDSLATPMNAIFYGIDGVKGVCQMDSQVENIVAPEWAHLDSPPMTPGFIQPQSLMSNGTVSDLLSAPSCSSLSPSPSPHPNSAHSDDLDFCDPRNLTVGPGPSTDSSLAKTTSAQTFPPLPTLCAGDDEEHRYMLGGETIHKAIDPSSKSYHLSALCTNALPIFDQLSELDTEDDLNGWVNFPTTDNVQFFGAKRQRTASGSDLVSLHSEQFMGEDDSEEVEESDETEHFATAQLHNRPSVAVSDRKLKKERRAKKTKKVLCDEDSTEFDNLVRSRKYTVAMQSAGGEPTEESVAEAPSETAPSQAGSSDGTNGNIAGSDAGARPYAPVTRRGRKQSLTEDPSKTFVCDLCNRRFRRQEHLKRHYRSLHTQDKPFECHECGKKFSRSDNLSQHARTHGSGAIVMGVLEDGELHGDLDGSEGEHIQNLGSVLFRVAAATSGSDTERTSEGAGNSGDESQSRKKRKRSE